MRTELLLATLILGTAACGDPPAPAGGSASAKGSGAKPPMSAAKSATATAAVTTSAAPTASAAPDMKAVMATCTHKVDAVCKEYLGKLPAGVEDSCAGKDKKGELVKGSTPCTHENALGSCEAKVGDLEEVHHFYKKAGATEATVKKACDDAKGTWLPEPAGAASGRPATSGAPSAAPAKK